MPVDSGSGERHPVNAWWRPLGDDRIALLAAMAMVAAFLYGSLLPFDLHRPDALNPITWLQQIRRTSWAQTSGTDLAVNIVVGTLLGFLLTGALRTGRGKHLNAGVAVLVVVCAATTLSAAVEMLQFLSPSRIASWNDVLGQVLGVVVGAVAWNPIGDRLLRWLHALANERESLSFAASVLQLYLPLYVLIQLTPLEKDLAVKYANSRMLLLPVTRYFEFTFPALRNVLGDVLLSVPIGALSVLAWVPKGTHRSVRHAVLLGGSIVVAVETIHGAIWSHYASLIDIVSGSMGTAIGALAAVTWARSRVTGADRQSRRRLLVLLLIVWILMMMVEYWYPFDFDVAPELTRQRLAHFPWIPFASYYPSYASAPLDGIRELLSRFLLAIPLGVLVRSALPDAREGWLSAVLTTGVATILMLLIAVGALFASGVPRHDRSGSRGDRRRSRRRDCHGVCPLPCGRFASHVLGSHGRPDRRRWRIGGKSEVAEMTDISLPGECFSGASFLVTSYEASQAQQRRQHVCTWPRSDLGASLAHNRFSK